MVMMTVVTWKRKVFSVDQTSKVKNPECDFPLQHFISFIYCVTLLLIGYHLFPIVSCIPSFLNYFVGAFGTCSSSNNKVVLCIKFMHQMCSFALFPVGTLSLCDDLFANDASS